MSQEDTGIFFVLIGAFAIIACIFSGISNATSPSSNKNYSSTSKSSANSSSKTNTNKTSGTNTYKSSIKDDPYNTYWYDDADDFAADWADEFDSYDDAYDYWEDEH